MYNYWGFSLKMGKVVAAQCQLTQKPIVFVVGAIGSHKLTIAGSFLALFALILSLK